jgi:Phosphoglycerate dehydrogenase and related dehydrogenases
LLNILVDVKLHKEKLEYIKSLSDVNVEVVDYAEEKRYLPGELLKNKHILFCTFPCTNFKEMESLEFIQIASTGYTQLFGLALAERGIRAANARGIFDVPIAEWCISMMVNLARDLRGMIRNQEARIWDRPARFQHEIRGSIVGIWGYGSIGRETARLAKCMGMKVYAFGRHIKDNPKMPDNTYSVKGTGDPEGVLPDRIFSPGQEQEFLKDLDFLVLTMPLTNNTKGIVSERELKMLPPKAYILNPARGPLIEEEALLKALREDWIAGAALDTHYYYPMPADHPLWCFPNVIFTPHISGSSLSPNFTERLWDIFIQNVERIIAGKPLLNELTEAQLRGE